MYKVLVLQLVVSVFCQGLFSQEGIKYHHYDDNRLKEVEFANGSRINVHDINPYLVDCPAKYESTNVTIYSFNKIDKDISNKYYYDAIISEGFNLDNISHLSAVIYTINCEDYNTFYAVSFLVLLFYGEDLVGCKSTIRLFDDQGNIIFNVADLPLDICDLAITKDGKLFAIRFGEMWTEQENDIIDQGIRVYNTSENKLVEEVIAKDVPGFGLVGMASYNDLIKLNLTNGQKEIVRVTFYSSTRNKKYTREMTSNKYYNIKDILSQGLIFENSPTDTILFEAYFNSEVLK